MMFSMKQSRKLAYGAVVGISFSAPWYGHSETIFPLLMIIVIFCTMVLGLVAMIMMRHQTVLVGAARSSALYSYVVLVIGTIPSFLFVAQDDMTPWRILFYPPFFVAEYCAVVLLMTLLETNYKNTSK